ncbi:hypothetical protein K461DRAFT_231127 [Myriangium duriaei CBS 260.36]|uniref:Mpv17/PMP22 family protein n=1 Tax=Myriangium duriaei CBS 260.36 TaxID=1168546 RepID=A0A9P4IXF6_9PEZI|nr:hypothetical protein K461DRAFT_231127 [Myriangium duriaei CBS 260.36]
MALSSDLLLRCTLQSVILASLSNILAQLLSAHQSSQPYSIDPLPLARYTTYSLLISPLNVAWQAWLEHTFPAYPPSPSPSSSSPSTTSKSTRGTKDETAKGNFSYRNTAVKFLLDQTIGALFNTVLFIAGMDLLRGERDWSKVGRHVRGDMWGIMRAGTKVWPLVSLISFTVVPLEYRAAFGGLVGIGWGVFLSLVEGRR